MAAEQQNENRFNTKKTCLPTVCRRFASGELLEMVHDPERDVTSFIVSRAGQWTKTPSYQLENGEILVPYRATNSLIRHRVVLLPREPEEFENTETLVSEVAEFIHRYVSLNPDFELLASYYVLFTWIYDAFNEVPYLRILGDYGTGKTRFLLIVGALTMRPVFASGASTVSPIFHALDAFRGTLVVDEADFRFSDEKSEIVKILNNGSVRGLPVLRTEINAAKEYSPRAFSVFGPKIIASRGSFEDDALESRFLTERAGVASLRNDVPINLPDAYRKEAGALRDKLFTYRLRTLASVSIDEDITAGGSPRQAQILRPLLSIVYNAEHRARICRMVEAGRVLMRRRAESLERELLRVLVKRMNESGPKHVTLQSAARVFGARHGDLYGADPSPRWIGHMLRSRLGVRSRKINGNFAIGREERARIIEECEHFGVPAPSDEADLKWEPVPGPADPEETMPEIVL